MARVLLNVSVCLNTPSMCDNAMHCIGAVVGIRMCFIQPSVTYIHFCFVDRGGINMDATPRRF